MVSIFRYSEISESNSRILNPLCIEAGGLELVDMVLANTDDWDRYQASQWLTASDGLAANPGDPDASEVREMTSFWRRSYLTDLRRCMGWGVFVVRDPAAQDSPPEPLQTGLSRPMKP